jgi:hypothetical protein
MLYGFTSQPSRHVPENPRRGCFPGDSHGTRTFEGKGVAMPGLQLQSRIQMICRSCAVATVRCYRCQPDAAVYVFGKRIQHCLHTTSIPDERSTPGC